MSLAETGVVGLPRRRSGGRPGTQVQNLTHPHGRIKGAAIRDFVAWYERTYGTTRLIAAVSSLPGPGQAEFDTERECLGVLASTWFPAAVVHGVLDHLTSHLTEAEEDDLAARAGEAVVKAMMTGVQRVVFSTLMTPRTYLKIANLAFHANFDTGRVLNEEAGPKRHRGHVEGWTSHHPFLCKMNVEIKKGIYGAMGCKRVKIDERYCRDRGGSQCGSVISWE